MNLMVELPLVASFPRHLRGEDNYSWVEGGTPLRRIRRAKAQLQGAPFFRAPVTFATATKHFQPLLLVGVLCFVCALRSVGARSSKEANMGLV